MNAGTNAITGTLKRVVPLLLLVLVCHTYAQAQVRLGVLGGIHSSKVLETNNIPGWDTAVKKYQGSRSGFQLGVIIEVPLGKGLFFQPAITYTSKGRKYDRNNDSITSLITDTIYNKQTLNLGYIEIPLNLTYKVPLTANHKNSFFISAGPYLGFFYSGNITSESLTGSTNKFSSVSNPVTVGKGPDTYKTFDFGLNGRAGFELGNFLLSAYFSQGLSNFYTATYPGTFHHQVAGASIGFWLTSTGTPPPVRKKDTDKDGVTDDQDMCPLQPGTAAWHGCPVPDTDHDGIDDEHDSCKNIPGVARYNGCPIPDSDHDGINDEEDKCPLQAGVGRYQGCPIPDRDHDGVNDEEDKCPDSAGTAENQGCPIVKEIKKDETDKINYIAHNILFNPSSVQLTDSSYLALDELAALLQAHPEWHVTIEGYTDNSGSAAKNLQLSQYRASAVKVYLVKKGVAENRLSAVGFGQQHPIADNKSLQGKAANRRVELKLSTGN
jgi:outer membrane protein OmpA-like peptidoglycan-associated protein